MRDKDDPYFDRAMRGWIIKTATKNYWRVADWYELDDLIQDGYMCYCVCHRKYRALSQLKHPRDEQKRRFMALVKTTFSNHITDLANSRTQTPETALSRTELTEAGMDRIMKHSEELTARLLLQCAPQEVKALATLLATEGKEAVKYVRTRVKNGHRMIRETTNEHLSRRLGLDPTNLYDMFREHFGMIDPLVGRWCGKSYCCW